MSGFYYLCDAHAVAHSAILFLLHSLTLHVIVGERLLVIVIEVNLIACNLPKFLPPTYCTVIFCYILLEPLCSVSPTE